MPIPLDRDVQTQAFGSWDQLTLESGSVYIYGMSSEERSVHPPDWERDASNTSFVRVLLPDDPGNIDFTNCEVDSRGVRMSLPLRGREQLVDYLISLSPTAIYIDITGLPHHIWAPLLRASISTPYQVRVVYVEPLYYAFSRTPTEADIFDLSERVHGILPLPGFSVFDEPESDESTVLIAFLGFEGHRFAHILEQTQPPGRKIIPVIGVPGFRPEFAFHAYLGNKNVLAHASIHSRIRYAMANSAFHALYLLREIASEHEGDLMRITPIGTKPHALGAVLFALESEARRPPVEIVYDHPIRSINRTIGTQSIILYDLNLHPLK